jgi:hypothetical protein
MIFCPEILELSLAEDRYGKAHRHVFAISQVNDQEFVFKI